MRNIKRLFILSLILSLSLSLSAKKLDKDLTRGFDSISPMEAYNYVKTMALPKFAGRYTGHEGYTAAAKWAAAKFKKWGLKSINSKEGYLQAFPRPYAIIPQAKMTLLKGEKQEKVELEAEDEFLPLLATDSGDNTAELVFAGWGISAPELGYDDYAGLDVKGKFILCFRGVPDRSDPGFQKHDEHRFRMQMAKDKGAKGLFYIYSRPIANPNMDLIKGFTNAIISEKVADKIFEEKGFKATELQKDLQTYKKPLSFSLVSKMHYQVEAKHFPQGTGYNIIGYVEGSDPVLKQECLVFGGHFDHCGEHVGILFPGANDNASGSAVVMEIAEAFSKLKQRPKRSVVFVLFGGEEMGLLGSSYFVDHIPSQFKKVDTMFNFDMVGEGDGARCSVSPEPKILEDVLKKSDETINILKHMSFFKGTSGGSDYAPFLQKSIPCYSFSSNGPHLEYHRSGDTIFRINPDIMADIARLAFLTGYTLANNS